MSTTTKFVLIPINERANIYKYSPSNTPDFLYYNHEGQENNSNCHCQVLLFIDTKYRLTDDEQCLAYEQNKIVNHVCLNEMGVGQGAFYKILASSSKTITPNNLISEPDIREIVNQHNRYGKLPQWQVSIAEKEYGFSNDFIIYPNELMRNKNREVIFKQPESEYQFYKKQVDRIKSNHARKHTSKTLTEFFKPFEQMDDKEKIAYLLTENEMLTTALNNSKQLGKALPTDEEIHKEAFRLQTENSNVPLKFEFNINDWKNGAKWVRDNYTQANKSEKTRTLLEFMNGFQMNIKASNEIKKGEACILVHPDDFPKPITKNL